MPTFKTLIDRVKILVDDDSLTDSLGDFINQGVSEIAGGLPSLLDGINNPIPNMITPPLPDLFTMDVVVTSTNDPFIDMPDNFQRDLQLVVSSSGNEIDIANSFIAFVETYPLLNKIGTISESIEHGGKLYYQGIPKIAETITLHYYRKPIDMVEDTDTPDGIPNHLQISLLTSFAAWKSYEILEDGIEDKTPNTIKYKNIFLETLRTFELSLPAYTRGLMLR